MYEVTVKVRRTTITDFRTFHVAAEHAYAALQAVALQGKDVVELKKVG